MIEIIGPLLIALGPICFTLSAYLEHLFSPPEKNQDDIDTLEDDQIRFFLKRIFNSVTPESFDDPAWIRSAREYYNSNIKDLRDAERVLTSLHSLQRHVKVGIVILGITLIIIGSIYTVVLTTDIFEDPKDLVLMSDTILILSLVVEIGLIGNFLRKYKKNKKELEEIFKSQELLLRGMFIRGDAENGET